VGLGFELGFTLAKQVLYHLIPPGRLTSNRDPPDLPSGWDYRQEPLAPGLFSALGGSFSGFCFVFGVVLAWLHCGAQF
jgi:hypothetical protein